LGEFQKQVLIETCCSELKPLTENPAALFAASLNGEKIFENLYREKDLPSAIADSGLTRVYTLLCPRIATLICKLPAAIKEWESQAWSENFKRLDELAQSIVMVSSKVDELVNSPSKNADKTLNMVRRTLAQKAYMELDLTGLRADKPLAGKFDDFFVHPQISEDLEQNEEHILSTADGCFEHFIGNNATALIIGAPGAGKSTWTRWLNRETVTDRWHGFTVRTELRSLNHDNLPSLQALVRETSGKHLAEELTNEHIRCWLDQSLIAFVFDGFDEVLKEHRAAILAWINQLKFAAQACPILLTSRPLTTDHLDALDNTWSKWQIDPFSEERIIEYIGRWYEHTPRLIDNQTLNVDVESLTEKWFSDPVIAPLTSNPLLLSTLVMVHHLDGCLPNGRSQLYERYINGMLGIWDERRNISTDQLTLSLNQKRHILRQFALHLHFTGQDNIEEDDTIILFERICKDMALGAGAQEVLALLRERSGLIVGPGIYSFIHKTVGEFLVAECAVQGDQLDSTGKRLDRMALFDHRDDDRWNAVIFLWAGLAPISDVESFVYSCNDVNNFKLAYGIVYDQYDRFSAEMRRSMLLELFTDKCKSLEFDFVGPLAFGNSSFDSTTLSNIRFGLRGLNNHIDMADLFNIALIDGCICWADCEHASDIMRKLFWVVYAKSKAHIDIWKQCLGTVPSSQVKAEWWRYVLMERQCLNLILRTHTENINERIVMCSESHSDYKKFLHIAAISAISRVKLYGNKVLNSEAIYKILVDVKNLPIFSSKLQQTHHWNLGLVHDVKEFDLFADFEEYIDESWADGSFQDETLYKALKNTLNTLITLRGPVDTAL
jgi:hypothetical protein